MNDELDALWPDFMLRMRDEIRAERAEAKRKDAERDAQHPDCSTAELQRQKMQDARREQRDAADAFYRGTKFRKQGAR